MPVTSHRPTRLFLAMAVALLLLPAPEATAQLFSYDVDRPRAVQSLAFGYTLLDFRYNGDDALVTSFEFTDPAYGAVYTRPHFMASLAFGAQAPPAAATDARRQRLVDATLSTWGEIYPSLRLVSERARLFIPILLYSNYRRVSRSGEEDSVTEAFNITVLGLGTGVGFSGHLGGGVLLEARATPVIGLGLHPFGDATGSSRLFTADVLLHVGSLLHRLGLSVGYRFQHQVWNINASSLFPEDSGDLFDYRSRSHTFHAGVNW